MAPLHLLVLVSGPERHDALVRALRDGGHRVLSTSDGAAAAEAIGTGDFDALVLDLRWPELESARLREVLAPSGAAEPENLEAAERRHIALTLRHTSGNRRRAAQF